jgi:hypothetical protein
LQAEAELTQVVLVLVDYVQQLQQQVAEDL